MRLLKLSAGTILLSGRLQRPAQKKREFVVWQLHFRTKQKDSESTCPSEVAIELTDFNESGVTNTRSEGKNIHQRCFSSENSSASTDKKEVGVNQKAFCSREKEGKYGQGLVFCLRFSQKFA